MEKKNVIHDKITVEAIVLEEGSNKLVFKVKDPLSIPESDNYLLVSKNLKTSGIYLSPDQCNALQMMSYCKKSTKDDVWALGMVLL